MRRYLVDSDLFATFEPLRRADRPRRAKRDNTKRNTLRAKRGTRRPDKES